MQVLRWKRLCRGGAHRLLACTATAPGCCVHPDGPAVTPEPQHSCLWFLLCMSLHPLSTWTLRIHFLCLKLKFLKRQHLIGLASHHQESISLPGRRPGWVLSRLAAHMLMAASGSMRPQPGQGGDITAQLGTLCCRGRDGRSLPGTVDRASLGAPLARPAPSAQAWNRRTF